MGAASAVGRNPGAATPILVQAILAIAFAEAIVFYALFLVSSSKGLPIMALTFPNSQPSRSTRVARNR